MKLTKIEKVCLMDVILDNLKSGGHGVLISEKEYEWMLNYLIEDDERYEDCVILETIKKK